MSHGPVGGDEPSTSVRRSFSSAVCMGPALRRWAACCSAGDSARSSTARSSSDPGNTLGQRQHPGWAVGSALLRRRRVPFAGRRPTEARLADEDAAVLFRSVRSALVWRNHTLIFVFRIIGGIAVGAASGVIAPAHRGRYPAAWYSPGTVGFQRQQLAISGTFCPGSSSIAAHMQSGGRAARSCGWPASSGGRMFYT